MAAERTYEVDRIPVHLQYQEKVVFQETYGFGGNQGYVNVEGIYFKPRGRPSKTIVLFMHPSSTLQLMPLPTALAKAGVHLMCCGSRYPKNDAALIMEKVALDLGAYVRYAKEVLGYKTVILGGWSGGGSLTLFYQSQAERPTVTHTPAGDPADLTGAGLIPADACMFLAAHISRARTLTEWMDASVTDELNPDKRIVELDLYDPNNPNQAPYKPEFIKRYRAAQIERNRRITKWVHETIDTLKKRNNGEMERGFVVHRTMADPRFIDPTVDPNDRKPNWSYMGDPRTVNVGPVGMARFCTLRSWLSQWSYDETRADGLRCAPGVTVPLLSIENSADDAAPSSHTKMIHEAIASQDKTMHTIKGATHYYQGQPELLAKAVGIQLEWLRARNLLE
ncbi:MAG: alpha/beta hydrolase [Alphaproteobacteria bacterium]